MNAQTIGEYVLEGELGSGTAGTAYRARHSETQDVVAIKLLAGEMSEDETMQRRFIREMSVMSKLEHENIVKYFQGGLHEDRFFYVMELVDFATLKEVLANRGALTWQEAAECARQICIALQFAHEHGVIHRDLKPANLFVSNAGLVKLGDFGLARDLGNDRLTIEGFTVGTVRYMPPEQITGEAEITGATDLYALGCLLYEMLTGRVPFDGDTTMDLLNKHITSPPPDVRELAPSCPAELRELLFRLLAKNPADRPPSAGDVAATLSRILSEDAVEEKVEAAANEANLAERLRSGPTTSAPRQVSWIPLVLVGAVVLVAIVVAAVLNQ